MNTDTLADTIAHPIQVVGMSFYFDPLTGVRARENGVNIVEFYGLGRGGTLGDVDEATVVDAFYFFHPRFLNRAWTMAKEKADPVTIAANYLQAAYEFADRTFGGIETTVLANFAAAAQKVASRVDHGRHHLVDGYKQYAVPVEPAHAAYLGSIVMRELRGCVHIDAVNEMGISAVEACYVEDPSIFTLHGYTQDEAPVLTAETEAKKQGAEEITSATMAEYFTVLSAKERQYLCDGALAMFDALRNPIAVAP